MLKSSAPGLLGRYLQYLKKCKGYDRLLNNVKIITLEDGYCKAEWKVQEDQTNAFGNLHGGFSASMVDMVSGIALLSHKREGGGVSINLNLTFMKGANIGDDVIIEAKTVKAGKKFGFLECEIKNKATGDVLVSATHTKFIE